MANHITITRDQITKKSDPAGILGDLEISVAKEIVDIAGKDNFPDAVTSLGIVGSGATVTGIECDQDKWTRLGGETYALSFHLRTDQEVDPHLILKASTSMLPGPYTDDIIKRRKHIESHGVRVPKLWGEYNAMVLDEFIERDIHDAAAIDMGKTLEQSAKIFGVLSGLGYKPIARGIMRDLRLDDAGELVMIDFGSDLGAAEAANAGNDLWEIFTRDAAETLKIDSSSVMEYKAAYEQSRDQTLENDHMEP